VSAKKITPGEYAVEKVKTGPEKGKWKVYNTVSGKVHSYHTTKKNAKHQKQLLYAVGHGWKPAKARSIDDERAMLMYPSTEDE
jgi:hypothetical protein